MYRYGDDSIMVIGGFLKARPTDQVLSVDIKNNKVTYMPSMNKRRYSHSCAKVVLEGVEVVVVAGKYFIILYYTAEKILFFLYRWI